MAEQKCHIYIIGIGMGAPENLTVEAGNAIEEAGLLIGAKRMLEPYEESRECVAAYQAEEIVKIIENQSKRVTEIAVLMSGDSGFYSGTKELLAALYTVWGKEQVRSRVTVLPGISSLSYFCAKIGKSWENAELVNLHGVQENLWQAVLTHEKVFAITGGNAQQQLRQLTEHGLGEIYGYVGENLSYMADSVQEKITEGMVRELAQKSYAPLSVLYLENPAAVSSHLWGLPDESFVRGEVPMTKAEVRAVVMSKLRIREKDVVYDVGAGTGSVSVEMALAARKGSVYAIETNSTAVELCKLNKERFCLHNLEIVKGTAPDVMPELPRPDVAFIGGSKGKMAEIVELLLRKNPAIRLVINTVTVENTAKALELLDTERFVDVEMVQLQVNKAKKVGTSHMMTANNPITIFTAKGKETPS
ncbi:MAG: precorrin-6Y C5,15-methyltransferase (decarboxylating) subunit CbiT [Lachnospiraceae bacterium]|nr:precorrin-6Y C5,15-methyltransferase (decarboxylating) subunit CbiT [Lachnospiraceae bacterium]